MPILLMINYSAVIGYNSFYSVSYSSLNQWYILVHLSINTVIIYRAKKKGNQTQNGVCVLKNHVNVLNTHTHKKEQVESMYRLIGYT